MASRRSSSARTLALAALVSMAVPGAALACDLSGFYAKTPAANWDPAAGVPGSDGRATTRAAPAACPTPAADSDPISPDITVNGEFTEAQQGAYVLVPFQVPAGMTAVRVKYCYDQPDATIPGVPLQSSNTLDLGLYEARSGPDDLWDEDEFRGWGGSSHPDVTVAPNGFSSEADYLASPRLHRRGHTTRGFEPGPIPPGEWAVELGAASVSSQLEGDSDGKLAWRVEIDLIADADYANDPYQPAPYDPAPANPDPGWYAGDLHVHSEHSALGDATMNETFDYAFKPLAEGGAGLDFLTLSDYVTDTGWGEIGRYQGNYPGKLIERSAEVITYRGHTNNHGSHTFADYRTGPIYQWDSGGALTELRGATPASRIFDAVHGAGGWTQINHPTIFPSLIPGFSSFCRGCPWDYSAAETDYSKVDAIEVATGPSGLDLPPLNPGPNPFTLLAIQFYDAALATGNRIAAVAVSDSHKAGRVGTSGLDPITQAPIGEGTTVVRADELSEEGIERGVEAGHTYAKIEGNDGPDLRLEATDPTRDEPAIMGDAVRAESTQFSATVTGAGLVGGAHPGPYLLLVVKDGLPLLAAPVLSDDFTLPFPSLGIGRYRLQLMRLSGVGAVSAVSSPIYLDPNAPPDRESDPEPGPEPGPVGGAGGAGTAGMGGDAGASVNSGRCTTPRMGTPGRDRLRGTGGGDSLIGLAGRDRLLGLAGEDCLFGGPGRDRLAGGPGADLLFGGPGNDSIQAKDGLREIVNCGGGRRDRAAIDRIDRPRGCERVKRA